MVCKLNERNGKQKMTPLEYKMQCENEIVAWAVKRASKFSTPEHAIDAFCSLRKVTDFFPSVAEFRKRVLAEIEQ